MSSRIIRGEVSVRLTVNNKVYEGLAEPRTLLSDFLRHELGLTGTRVGCEQGVCGACTVHLDGRAVRACLMLAIQAEGHELQTIEIGEALPELSKLQNEFTRAHALQCGFCTPGMLMSLSSRNEGATPRTALTGHLCRCTGYQNIARALDAVQQKSSSGSDHEE